MNSLEKAKVFLEYLKIWIDLRVKIETTNKSVYKEQLPTYEYFIKNYNNLKYSLIIPHYSNYSGNIHCKGYNPLGELHFNIWMGIKYYL